MRPINMEMSRTHSDFEQYVRWGKEWEWKAYSLLRQRYPAIRPPKTAEYALAKFGRHSPDPDADMSLHGFPIECKRRKFDFTNQSDYPYESFYIDEEYKLRDKVLAAAEYYSMPESERLCNIRPFMMYLTCNASMTHMGVVIPASKPYWRLDRKQLTKDDRKGDSWACQLNKVIFTPVSDWRTILTRI